MEKFFTKKAKLKKTIDNFESIGYNTNCRILCFDGYNPKMEVYMLIDVSPLLRGEVGKIDIDYTLHTESLGNNVVFEDAAVSGTLTDNAGYMRLCIKAELPYKGECARCLAPVDGVFSLDFERTVAPEGMLTDEQIEDNVDEYIVLCGKELDIDEQLREELILSFPSKLLCDEDCPGLCPKCGKPLRDGPCGCPTKEIDPRLAVLKTFFDNNEEENNK